MKLVTAAQMLALEAAAVEAGISERELMEAAGLAAAQEAWMSVGAIEQRPVLVLVGPGSNGGDGLVAARRLAEMGGDVTTYLLRPRDDADAVWQAAVAAGVPAVLEADDDGFERLDELLASAACILDALLGTGTSRAIEGPLAEILLRLAAVRTRPAAPQIIALDLPSGVDADTGGLDPATVEADITVAFGYPKVGLFTMPARRAGGRIIPVDIGIPAGASAQLPYEEIDFRQTQAIMPPRPAEAHKGTFGRVVVAAGSRRYPGAARLAAEAAARSGAGLTVLAAPESIQPLLVSGLPDVVHEPLPSTDGALDGEAARALLRVAGEADAMLVGPGLSLNAGTREFVRSLLDGMGGIEDAPPLVLDADALNVLAENDGWHERLSVTRVLTPHPGEMARLTGSTTTEVQADRLQHATDYARQTSSVVVLKGACTIVAAPDGRARISPAANPMLATAGTGDVLAGLIAGLIAQGVEPYDAASAAVYMHAECGRLVAEAYGMAAGLAQDLLRVLPEVRKLLDGA